MAVFPSSENSLDTSTVGAAGVEAIVLEMLQEIRAVF